MGQDRVRGRVAPGRRHSVVDHQRPGPCGGQDGGIAGAVRLAVPRSVAPLALCGSAVPVGRALAELVEIILEETEHPGDLVGALRELEEVREPPSRLVVERRGGLEDTRRAR